MQRNLAIFLAAIILVCFAGISLAGEKYSLGNPKITKENKLKYRMVKDNGNNISFYTQEIIITKFGKIDAYKIVLDKNKDGETVIYLNRESLAPLAIQSYTEKKELESDGVYKNGKYINKKLPSGESKEIDVSGEALDYNSLAFVLRGFPFVNNAKMDLKIVINSTTLWARQFTVTAKYAGKDDITTPAGKFNCHKIEVAPGGVLGLIAPKTARSVFYFSTDPVPIMIKYESKFDKAVVELIEK